MNRNVLQMEEKLTASTMSHRMCRRPTNEQRNVDFTVTTNNHFGESEAYLLAPLFAYTVYGTHRTDDARMAWLLHC